MANHAGSADPFARTYEQFFERAAGHRPYPHQIRFAQEPWADRILIRPTASGKTAEVVLKWMWGILTDRKNTPTRLVLCLPARTLVEQAAGSIGNWIRNVNLEIPVHKMLGGDIDRRWSVAPEAPSVLVGTQDLLLSAALNRGYAASRYRWPVDFGFLNSDVLWINDEVQLMGAGLPTTAQLAAFRRSFGVFGPTYTVWMSATLDTAALATPDFAIPDALTLSDSEQRHPELARRLSARKSLQPAPPMCRTPEGLARFARQEHRPGHQTIVIVNRVERAVEVFLQLRRAWPGAADSPALHLLHSRFRPSERQKWHELLSAEAPASGRIIVSTQVIEAGVDISSELLITDVAPYASLIQRFGRTNRAGELPLARIFWVDRPLTSKLAKLESIEHLDEKQTEQVARPYAPPEIQSAIRVLEGLTSASAKDLPPYRAQTPEHHILRRRDLIDLFDTSRDLSGFDIDISRFVRGGDDNDLYVAWRGISAGGPQPDNPRLQHQELCPVPIGDFREFLKKTAGGKRRTAWTWDALTREWRIVSLDEIRPGLAVLLDSQEGGYDVETGWDPSFRGAVPSVGLPGSAIEDSWRSRRACSRGSWRERFQSIRYS